MRFSFYPVAVFAAFVLLVSHCNAQSVRTWVSGTGNDANPCSRTAPCQTFAGAISKTNAEGVIDVLDPGDFGFVTINKSITIRADHVEAGTSSTSGGIEVSAGNSGTVVLEGLDLQGNGHLNGQVNGVNVLTGATVYILRCSIRGFTSTDGYDGNGVLVQSSTAGARVFIRDSFIEGNSGGVYVNGNATSNSVAISNSIIDHNGLFALKVGPAGNAAALINSFLSGSPTGLMIEGGTVESFGPSNVITGTGSPTSTVSYR